MRVQIPRILRSVVWVVLLAALTGIGFAPMSSASMPVTSAQLQLTGLSSSSIVGAWDATVTAPGSVVHPTLTFNADKTVDLLAENNAYTGTGLWQGDENGAFTFFVRHPALDASGHIIGEIFGAQYGTVQDNRFTSSGPSQLVDLAGHPQGPPHLVSITATRRS